MFNMTKFLTAFVLFTLVVSFVSYIQPRQTLDDYHLRSVNTIEGLRNASGVTTQESTGSMWMVINSPAKLFEVNRRKEFVQIQTQREISTFAVNRTSSINFKKK